MPMPAPRKTLLNFSSLSRSVSSARLRSVMSLTMARAPSNSPLSLNTGVATKRTHSSEPSLNLLSQSLLSAPQDLLLALHVPGKIEIEYTSSRHLFRFVSKHLGHSTIHIGILQLRIKKPDSFVCGFDNTPISQFAVPDCILRALALSNIRHHADHSHHSAPVVEGSMSRLFHPFDGTVRAQQAVADLHVGIPRSTFADRCAKYPVVIGMDAGQQLLACKGRRACRAEYARNVTGANNSVSGQIPLVGVHLSRLSGKVEPRFALAQRVFRQLALVFRPPLLSNVFDHRNDKRGWTVVHQRNTQPAPDQGTVPAKIAFLHLVEINGTGSQLLKQSPILLGIFGRRKLYTVFLEYFVFAEPQHRAKRGIHEQWLPF